MFDDEKSARNAKEEAVVFIRIIEVILFFFDFLTIKSD